MDVQRQGQVIVTRVLVNTMMIVIVNHAMLPVMNVVEQKNLIVLIVLLVITNTKVHANKLVLKLIIKMKIPGHVFPVYKIVKNVQMILLVIPVTLVGT